MARAEQIDRMSKKYVKLSANSKKYAKKQHSKYIRKIAKDLNKSHPQRNRYNGWIG